MTSNNDCSAPQKPGVPVHALPAKMNMQIPEASWLPSQPWQVGVRDGEVSNRKLLAQITSPGLPPPQAGHLRAWMSEPFAP